MNARSDLMTLRKEVLGLFEHIQKIRKEIASIHRPGQTGDRFTSMSDELDAIVASTESATNTIMEAAEDLDAMTTAVRGRIDDAAIQAELDRAPDMVGRIFEACSFQDITGQRITKVVTSLQFIEARVHKLISMWGETAIAEQDVEEEPQAGDKKYLNGPQLAGHGVSQADVDAMLKGDTPPITPHGAPLTPRSTRQVATEVKIRAKAGVKAPAKAPITPTKSTDGAGMDQNDIDKLFD